MSRDQMQDVFPIAFNYVKGEQPTAEKLTGLVKHTNTAFSRMTQAIGDTWDYTEHTDSTSAAYTLSPENLSIPSLARMIGPSDYLSPLGGSWDESMPYQMGFSLDAYKNTWNLGFPLVKKASATPLSPSSSLSSFIPLVWNTDFVFSGGDSASVFVTEKSIISEVDTDGDFYIDYYKGIITSYKRNGTTNISLTINANTICMLGPGVPWGTHNVIPAWTESTYYCALSNFSSGGGYDTWTLTLPTIYTSPRIGANSISTQGGLAPAASGSDINAGTDSLGYMGMTNLPIPSYSSSYRLPYSIASLPTTSSVPEGYCQLWDDDTGRVLPNIEFFTLGTTNTLTVRTPNGWLSGSGKYRLITSGTSIAENISYLNQLVRNGVHKGLLNYPTLTFSPLLSHNDLTNRYSGYISSSYNSNLARLSFRESSMPLNPHPQYLHRYGYDANDLDGNSANAMRGNLVFTGQGSSSGLGSGSNSGGGYNTYGILFGGATENDILQNSKINMEGRNDSSSWSSGVAAHFPFNVEETGTSVNLSYSSYYGALTVSSWLGTPLYLRGFKDTVQTSHGIGDWQKGAALAFDIGHWSEYNHIKVSVPIHISDTYEAANMPANTSQATTTALGITPSLSALSGFKRLSPYQIREFRFRGGAYLPDALNKATDSLGALMSSPLAEFNSYFTSPGMVGCDFLNLYSNAIFFSDTGDGKRTSFTSNGEGWLSTDANPPSGIYFHPRNGAAAPYFNFYDYDSTLVASNNSVSFGYAHGFYYAGQGDVTLLTSGDICFGLASNIATTASSANIYIESTNSTSIGSDGSVYSFAGGTRANRLAAAIVAAAANYTQYLSTLGNTQGIGIATFGSTSPITLATATSNINLSAGTGSDINLTADDDINLTATDNIVLAVNGTISLTADEDINLTATDGLNLSGFRTVSMFSDDISLTGYDSISAYSPILRIGFSEDSRFHSTAFGLVLSTTAAISLLANSYVRISGGSEAGVDAAHTGTVLVNGGAGIRLENPDTAGPAQALYVGSDLGGGVYRIIRNTSSARYKENIKSLDSIDWIYSLRPVSYNSIGSNSFLYYGLIAEEVELVNKELIVYNTEGKPDSVFYQSVFSALIKAIQNQKEEIDSLKDKISKM